MKTISACILLAGLLSVALLTDLIPTPLIKTSQSSTIVDVTSGSITQQELKIAQAAMPVPIKVAL